MAKVLARPARPQVDRCRRLNRTRPPRPTARHRWLNQTPANRSRFATVKDRFSILNHQPGNVRPDPVWARTGVKQPATCGWQPDPDLMTVRIDDFFGCDEGGQPQVARLGSRTSAEVGGDAVDPAHGAQGLPGRDHHLAGHGCSHSAPPRQGKALATTSSIRLVQYGLVSSCRSHPRARGHCCSYRARPAHRA